MKMAVVEVVESSDRIALLLPFWRRAIQVGGQDHSFARICGEAVAVGAVADSPAVNRA
jgi:hypothetical protein